LRTLAHLSDLHFGRTEHRVLEVLRRRVLELAPDLVVVSGDLTQRARPSQFRAARAYLERLPKPQIVVPGNHDVPLYNVFRRFFQPLAAYKRFISTELEPEYIDEEIAVLGVNTARSLVFKGGRINAAQATRVRERLCQVDRGVTKIVVTHHPFDVPRGQNRRQVVRRARMALERFAECGADVLLSGHLHASHVGHGLGGGERVPGFGTLVVQAGTATSSRTRAEPNAFNVLRVAAARIDVETYALYGDDFVRVSAVGFHRVNGEWTRGPA
jgi:3',5'-cyclic AMP phosphodiesterase CpdA